jgi:hypothetical protein
MRAASSGASIAALEQEIDRIDNSLAASRLILDRAPWFAKRHAQPAAQPWACEGARAERMLLWSPRCAFLLFFILLPSPCEGCEGFHPLFA